MRFVISRTSYYMSSHKAVPPVDGAVKVTDEQGRPVWVMDIESLEDLVALTEREGEIVLSGSFIEIYDDYRE